MTSARTSLVSLERFINEISSRVVLAPRTAKREQRALSLASSLGCKWTTASKSTEIFFFQKRKNIFWLSFRGFRSFLVGPIAFCACFKEAYHGEEQVVEQSCAPHPMAGKQTERGRGWVPNTPFKGTTQLPEDPFTGPHL